MDPGTGLTILGSAVGSAKVLEKMLGPTADYLGGGLRDWTERSFKNLGRIFEKARVRLGSKVDAPGGIPPRVLKEVLREGPFCEDELWAEYFGGVMASSRSEIGRDDRGARFASILGRLSTYQVRCHFLLYRLFKTLFDGTDASPNTNESRSQMQMFVPVSAFHSGMEIAAAEDLSIILSHSIVGLVSESLIDAQYQFGGADFIKTNGFPEADQPGLLVQPSVLGVELFHWAHGMGDLASAAFLKTEVVFVSDVTVAVTPGVRSVRRKDLILDEKLKVTDVPTPATVAG